MRLRWIVIPACCLMLLLQGCGGSGQRCTGAEGDKASNGIIADVAGEVLGFFQRSGDGAAAVNHGGDVKDSPYFRQLDVYNMKSGGSLVLLERYPTFQQTTGYTCGPAAALTVVRHYGAEDSEMAMAKVMDSHPAGVKDPGTNTRGMVRYFKEKGWNVRSSLTDGSPKSYKQFVSFVKGNLEKGIPIMVENVDWGGHWRVIIGFDSMGDDKPGNDVLIMADPYDTTDHLQDGYGIVPAQRFFHMWFDAQLFREGEKRQQWLTATPPGK